METKESNLNTGISRKKAAQERKAAARREKDRAYYQQNKEKKISQVKARRKKLQAEKPSQPLTRRVAKKSERQEKETQRREASRIAAQERREKIRQQTRERVRKYREKKQTASQEEDSGFPVQRNYFETSHAKGEQDAAGSHVKQKVSQAVLRRTATINNARSMYDFLVQHFSQPARSSFSARTNSVQLKRRIFYFVPSSGEGSVVRSRAGRRFRELKGIQKLHCVKTTPQQGKVHVRHRSCYCINCIVNDEEKCTNKAWLDEWKQVELAREGDVATTRQAAETPVLDQDTASYIADLANKSSTVAIAAEDDPVYDFYLLKIISEGVEELDSDVTDDYQCHYQQGDRVLRGHFYLRENIHDMTFTIDEKHTAIVYAATVRHICGELPVKKRGRKFIYKLPLRENEEIIASL